MRLLPHKLGERWSPDGHFLVYRGHRPHRCRVLPVKGVLMGEAAKIGRCSEPAAIRPGGAPGGEPLNRQLGAELNLASGNRQATLLCGASVTSSENNWCLRSRYAGATPHDHGRHSLWRNHAFSLRWCPRGSDGSQ